VIELSKVREQKFARLLEAKNQSLFYTKKLETYNLNNVSLNDLPSLPLTTKEDLRLAEPYDLVGVAVSEIAHYHESSGTTGISSSSWFTLEDLQTAGSQLNQMGVNLTDEDLVLIRFPFALSCTAFLMQQACMQASAGMVPASSRNTITPYVKVLELMQKLNVSVFAGLARELEYLIETAKMMGLSMQEAFPNLRAACVAGELLGDQRKKYLESKLGVPVYGFYGSTETANIASMCEYGIMHISEEDFIIEVLNEQTKMPEKTGEKGLLAVTTLSHQGSPMLRYVNEDIVTVKETNCRCGHSGRQIIVHGRAKERIVNSKGTILEALDIHEAVYRLAKVPLIWQIVESNEYLTALVDFGDEPLSATEIRNMEQHLTELLDLPVIVRMANKGELINRQLFTENTISLKPVYIKPQEKNSEVELTL
jgi:phenylacetate-CoA ligase